MDNFHFKPPFDVSGVACCDGYKKQVFEARIKLGMQVQDIQLLAINQTELVIGQIVEVIVEPYWVSEDGYVDIEAAESVAISSLDSYHLTHRVARLGYAKINQKPFTIPHKKT